MNTARFERKTMAGSDRPWYLNDKFIFVMRILLFPVMIIVRLFEWTYHYE